MRGDSLPHSCHSRHSHHPSYAAEQPAHGDAIVVERARRQMPAAETTGDRCVKLDAMLLDQNHSAACGDPFAHRSDREEGVGVHRAAMRGKIASRDAAMVEQHHRDFAFRLRGVTAFRPLKKTRSVAFRRRHRPPPAVPRTSRHQHGPADNHHDRGKTDTRKPSHLLSPRSYAAGTSTRA